MPAHTTTHRYEVFDGDVAILDVSDQPGPITSTAMPPPGAKPVMHPFLSASARNPMYEDRLKRLLDASHSFDEFVGKLRAAGFRLEPRP